MSDNEKQPLRISMAGKKVSEMTAQVKAGLRCVLYSPIEPWYLVPGPWA